MRLPRILVLAALALAACNTTKPLQVQRTSAAPAKTAKIGADEKSALFALEDVVSGIGSRESVIAFPANAPTPGTLCNYSLSGDQNFNYGGRRNIGDWKIDAEGVFIEEMTAKGFSVVGGSDDVFQRARSSAVPQYLVAGKFTKVSGNFCHEHHWYDGRPLYRYTGEMYVKLEWSVLDTATKEIVLTESHDGYYRLDEASPDGITRTFENAYGLSAAKLAQSPAMVALAVGDRPATASIDREPVNRMANVENGSAGGKFDIDEVTASIVTVVVGKGHGSGFFIGRSGYALTNAHVVGGARRVQLKLRSGVEVAAKVRHVDRVRDVALLKAEIGLKRALPLRREAPRVTEPVYAVGSPISEGLAMTVTRGIVSANRVLKGDNLRYIQADAAVSPGSSGGPLFDAKGRVIAIAVAKVARAEGLSLFVPIDDALDSVGVAVR